jgi:hypothetical protein
VKFCASANPWRLLHCSLSFVNDFAKEPLMIAVQDIHLLDEDSLRVLIALCNPESTLPLLIAGTLRPVDSVFRHRPSIPDAGSSSSSAPLQASWKESRADLIDELLQLIREKAMDGSIHNLPPFTMDECREMVSVGGLCDVSFRLSLNFNGFFFFFFFQRLV